LIEPTTPDTSLKLSPALPVTNVAETDTLAASPSAVDDGLHATAVDQAFALDAWTFFTVSSLPQRLPLLLDCDPPPVSVAAVPTPPKVETSPLLFTPAPPPVSSLTSAVATDSEDDVNLSQPSDDAMRVDQELVVPFS
jgi:hypothetical protein